MVWPRPVPLIGDTTSAADRAGAPDGWRFPEAARQALQDVVAARRDVRRYRPDPVPTEVLDRVLTAAHAAPSVGHSQPWRFLVVDDPALRESAALMADSARLAQAAQLDADSARGLLDLQLEGIREAPLGVVVCCDRRTPAAGVLGRATFPDADLWSCACAVQNLWLAARAEGLGTGWVTLFRPDELAGLLGLPDGVQTLGWLCLGWPDERPPAPGLERAGWSRRTPVDSVVFRNRWPGAADPAPPPSRLRAPGRAAVVGARDDADTLLTPPSSLGVLDRAVDRVVALGHGGLTGGTLLVAAGRHPVAGLGVTAFAGSVTDDLLDAARAGRAMGTVAARAAGLAVAVVDAGSATGDLRDTDPLTPAAARELLDRGTRLGAELAAAGLVALGEIGVGNTTVAAALTAALLDLPPAEAVGLGTSADSATLARKAAVVTAALHRWRAAGASRDPEALLAALGGPEFALLTGVVGGAARAGAVVVLDGLATGVAALVAVRAEPAVAASLVAGSRSRERAHPLVLGCLGLEPLLDLRLRAGEGVGAALGAQLLLTGLRLRAGTARTAAQTGTSTSTSS
ncbi:5,6-dimethylbenzimidazole synthase [Modestobacter sp. I12A-02628]|uniref:5,6-dimethylbenzimidazole synthase n=1 Tax=Goekera deserti TaxID=2497753 RepID=A0A7K3WAX1_9ACTN|nr:5,6-dimethylbenzimidazole synthase [Goekera deserti]MPQ97529.1 5,6-dimethylbenzimidazole synthase [Goekera deserti]NDI47867.1 5,6-dimethylbenzimidazole synthase [Goekera deserti]NEL53615.1 5,6-dimethylbenzimidazole synthase [Goekera deserti]